MSSVAAAFDSTAAISKRRCISTGSATVVMTIPSRLRACLRFSLRMTRQYRSIVVAVKPPGRAMRAREWSAVTHADSPHRQTGAAGPGRPPRTVRLVCLPNEPLEGSEL